MQRIDTQRNTEVRRGLHFALFTVSASTMMKRFLAEGKVGCHRGAVDCS